MVNIKVINWVYRQCSSCILAETDWRCSLKLYYTLYKGIRISIILVISVQWYCTPRIAIIGVLWKLPVSMKQLPLGKLLTLNWSSLGIFPFSTIYCTCSMFTQERLVYSTCTAYHTWKTNTIFCSSFYILKCWLRNVLYLKLLGYCTHTHTHWDIVSEKVYYVSLKSTNNFISVVHGSF